MTEQTTQQETTRVKAILYACQGMEASEEFDRFFKGYQEEIEKDGRFELTDSYKDDDILDNLIERRAIEELKGMILEQDCKYLIIPAQETLGVSLSAKADAVQAFKEIGVEVYILEGGIDSATYAEEQGRVSWKDFTKAMVEIDRQLTTIIGSLVNAETKWAKRKTV